MDPLQVECVVDAREWIVSQKMTIRINVKLQAERQVAVPFVITIVIFDQLELNILPAVPLMPDDKFIV